ncbi:metallophosphoesterase [Fulvivirgaceae bacterium PWU4]|uniref:Metallophosphoesterase n=1 Tax=Chryseosolibacter histidini TaxID=2782349 RepID=A0AAP2DKM5_9BACT|nr:metallophosphoesterase family protein [Chryseosolibacter histidini]MBT1698070.1 metallophosphoesterase [Chryseosolibacter histidini]
MIQLIYRRAFFALLVLACCFACKRDHETPGTSTVKQVMDEVITRLYATVPPEQYDSIDDAFILNFLTDEEKQVLATRYQHFVVNVPVVVSLMRHQDQQTIPFWLKDAGFVKTDQLVKNEEYTYEVWQKQYDAGIVELGINGFDKHRPVYFIAVGAQNNGDSLHITDVYPEYDIVPMREGAFTYHDWSDLTLTAIPQRMTGQHLFTTVRGRAREAHVINAFRKTPFPSGKKPDQVMLTWSDSPHTGVDIQWRADSATPAGTVRYWNKHTDTVSINASAIVLEDRMLMNDRYIKRFTAQLRGLTPGTQYFYQAGSAMDNGWSDVYTFQTEPEDQKSFSFVWLGDTHCFPDSGRLVATASKSHPDAAFYSIAGDLVSTGLNRDDWDKLFAYGAPTFATKPWMPVPGNHDRQDGLGAQMYYDLFSLPRNAPAGVAPESSYAFTYGDALFLMIDATFDVADHTAWIEEKLSTSKATWKFVMFHFPPYNFEEPYPEIQQAWVPLFDKYHVDIVMGGHIHYYMRSRPMFAGKPVGSFAQGTVYNISISIPSRHEHITEEPYAAKQFAEGYFYQHVQIDGKVLKSRTFDHLGVLRDEFVIKK